MLLSDLFIENFRIFGSEADGDHLRMKLRPGLNVLAGENDSGKTAIVDARRHILWTTTPRLASGIVATQTSLAEGYASPTSVFAADVDGDGDVDVLSASWSDDKIRLTSYHTGGNLTPTGLANDGEVEDYAWTIENDVHLYGSMTVDDVISVRPGTPGGTAHTVDIGGTVTTYDAVVYDTIYIDGLGGNDTITAPTRTKPSPYSPDPSTSSGRGFW